MRMKVERRAFEEQRAQAILRLFSKSPAANFSGECLQYEPYNADFANFSSEGLIFLENFTLGEDSYTGFLKKDKTYQPQGLGMLIYKDGSVYEGEWHEGKRHGHGRLVSTNGSSYVGEWRCDKSSGYGVFASQQGYKYEGDWLEEAQHGKGMETWQSSGARFVGDYLNSKKHGKGRFEWADGSYYEGDFLEGIFHGFGEYHFPDQQKTYFGEFRNGQVEGSGKEVWEDGREYVGDFVAGKKQGQGTLTVPDDKQYCGEWLNNLKDGRGFEILIKGNTRREGEWRKNKLVRWIGKTETVSGSIKTTNRILIENEEEEASGPISARESRQREVVQEEDDADRTH